MLGVIALVVPTYGKCASVGTGTGLHRVALGMVQNFESSTARKLEALVSALTRAPGTCHSLGEGGPIL